MLALPGAENPGLTLMEQNKNIPSNSRETRMPRTIELCGAAASFVMFTVGLVSLVTVLGGFAVG